MPADGPTAQFPQVIPRPAQVAPGDPAPWASLAFTRRRGLTLERVLTALERAGHAGPVAHRGGVADDDAGVLAVYDTLSPVEGAMASAVLVALFEERGETRVVLTRRSSALRSHTGQVSFPGGRLDPGEGPADAALREAAEEVGLEPAEATVVGRLHSVSTFSSGSFVTPVVATLGRRPVLVANPSEVARVFDAALADLVADGVFHEERWTTARRDGGPVSTRPLWFFDVEGETVWGATARILFELLSVVLGVTQDRT